MKRPILIVAAFVAALATTAQCTPNQLYADSIYGVWPDTTENFANGVVNVFYSDTLNILVPSDAGLINPDFDGFAIDSVALVEVTNLPPGLSVVCNSQTGATCTFLPNQVGCGILEGTPTTAGTYEMTVNVTAYSSIGGFPLPVDQSFGGYRITVAEESNGIMVVSLRSSDVRTVPNPLSGSGSIQFSLSKAGQARVSVFNLVGEKLWNRTVSGKQGANVVPFDASDLESGVYLYTLEVGGHTSTSRMVVNR